MACAHFILNGSIESADLESLSFAELLLHFSNNLEGDTFSTESHGLEGLKRCLDWAKRLEKNEWNEVLKEVSERAKRLAPSQTLLIPGGGGESAGTYWRRNFSWNRPMFYLLSRNEGDTYNLYVLNAGAGLEDSHAKREIDGKTQYLLARSYINIPKEELFYKKDPTGFFKPLLSYLKISSSYDYQTFDPKFIYNGALARLLPYQNDQPLIDAGDRLFIHPSKEGSESNVKLIKAFTRLSHFLSQKSQQDYKSWINEQRQFSLKSCSLSSSHLNDTTRLEAMARKVAQKCGNIIESTPALETGTSDALKRVHRKIEQQHLPPYLANPASYEANRSYSKPQPPQLKRQREPLQTESSSIAPLPLISEMESQDICAEATKIVSDVLNKVDKTREVDPSYLLHRIDLFAEKLSLRREDWTDGKAFSPLYNLLTLYYSLSVKENITPRTYTTLLTLYYAMWSLLPHTHDQLNQADFLDEESREKAKTLINTLVPPNDLFQQINHSLFFMITDPKEQKRFQAVKEAFDGWKPLPSSLMVFKEEFFDNQVIVDPYNPANHEHIFYQEYLKLLKIPEKEQPPEEQRRQEESQRPKLTYAETLKQACQERLAAYVKRKLEPRIQIANLLTQDEPWKTFLPLAFLRDAHRRFGALCYNRKAAEINDDLTCSSLRAKTPITALFPMVFCESPDQDAREKPLRESYGYPSAHKVTPPTFAQTVLPPILGKSWIAKILTSTVNRINEMCSQKDLWVKSSNQDPTVLKIARFAANVARVVKAFFSKKDLSEESLNELPPLLKMTAHMQNKEDKGGTFSDGVKKESAPLIHRLKEEASIKRDDSYFLKEVASLTSHKRHAAYNLLSLYSDHAFYLKEKDHRVSFLQQLFKTLPSDSKTIAQVGIENSPIRLAEMAASFANALETLAFEGSGHVDHELFLLGSYVISTLVPYYQNVPSVLESAFKRQKRRIDATLENLKSNSNERERSLYHLHALYHLTAANVPIENPEIWIHYFSLKMLPKLPVEYSFLERAVMPKIYSLASKLSSLDPNALLDLTQKVLSGCGFESIFGTECQFKDAKPPFNGGIVEVTNRSKKVMSLQYITGDLYLEGQKLRHINPLEHLSRLPTLVFGEDIPPANCCGDTTYFSHPAGKFERIDDQMIFHWQGKRLFFHEYFQLKEGFPFQDGYQHFYDPDEKKWIFFKEHNYTDPQSTLIYEETSGKICSLDQKSAYAPFQCPALEKIESGVQIYQKISLNTETIDVEVPRYGLSFTMQKSEGKLRWKQDPTFFLVDNTLPPNSLCIQKQCLVLKNEQEEQMLLAPCLTTKNKEKGFTRKAEGIIDLRGPQQSKKYHCYAVLRENEGKEIRLSPLTLEDALELAHYSLHDRNFHQFHSLLRGISPSERLDAKDPFLIIQKIFDYGEREKHHSAEVSASILKLALLFYQREKQPQLFQGYLKSFLSNARLNTLEQHYRTYSLSKKEVNESRQLSEEEEKVYEALFPPPSADTASGITNYIQKALQTQREYSDAFNVTFNPSKHLECIAKTDHCSKHYWQRISNADDFSEHLQCTVQTDYDFLQMYKKITNETEDLEAIETELHLNRCKRELTQIELALLCLKAKREGKALPSPLEYTTTIQEATAFKKAIEDALMGMTYSLRRVMNNKILPIQSQKKQESLDAKHVISYYPPDLSQFCRDDQPLFEKIGMQKEAIPFECLSPLPLACENVPAHFPYAAYLEKELERFNEEMQEGAKRLAKEKESIELGKLWKNDPSLKNQAQNALHSAQKKRDEAKKRVLEKVNASFDFSHAHPINSTQIGIMGNDEARVTIRDLESIVLWGGREADLKRIERLCPDFKDERFQKEVWDLLLTYEREAVYALGYQNVLLAYEKIDRSQNALEKEVHCAELANALRINLQTFASQQDLSVLECLIFVRCSSLFPRKDQLENIEALSKKGCVLQKIMGGGKTSVIAAIWAFQQARHQNKLPAIFAESSLYQSLIDNLKPGQQAAFQQHIFTINPSYAELHDPAQIEKIFNQLKEGFENKWVLAMKGETLQMLDLTFQEFSLENHPMHKDHREGLRKILNFFKDHVSGLADEVDLIVRSDFEVNLPTGEKQPLLSSRIDLVREMFAFLASHPSLGIREGTQGLRSPEELQTIFRALAQQLIDYKPLQLKKSAPEVKEAFCTYLLGSKDAPIPEALKEYIDLLRNAREEKEASELIALCRYLVSDILPSIFKQSPGVQFGRANRWKGCTKVVPFVGVDTPSTREFGNPYEWLSKQFFTSIIKGISQEALNVWIKKFVAEGKKEASFQNCSLKATRISKQFQGLTGQHLEDPDKNPQFVTDLFKKLEEDIERRLKIEAHMAREEVGYHAEYYNSSAQALPELVETIRGMTGTPWNYDGLSKKFGDLIVDRGAEGQIAQVLRQRQNAIHIDSIKERPNQNLSIEDLLKQAQIFPDVILDMGAFFKHQSIEESARAFLKDAQNRCGPNKKGVLFFHHQSGETTSDRIALGRFVEGTWTVTFLENTRANALKKEGFNPEDCVTFLDQRHTTGTDLPFPLNAHGLITANENVEMRTLLQTVMRLRRFCSSQSADFALMSPFYGCLKKGTDPVVIDTLLSYALQEQTQRKGDSNYSSYKQKIDEVFIEVLRSHSRKGEVHSSILAAYQPFQPRTMKDDPHHQFFCEQTSEPIMTILEKYAKARVGSFKEQIAQQTGASKILKKDLEAIQTKIDAILSQAERKIDTLPPTASQRQATQTPHVEAQALQQQEIQKEKAKIPDQEPIHDMPSGGKQREVKSWLDPKDPEGSVKAFIDAIRQEKSHPSNLLSAPNVLKKRQYKQPFDSLFPNTIFLTDAMQRTHHKWLPIYHFSQKIADSILIVKRNNQFFFVIVSQEEADLLKPHLERLALKESVYFVDPKGNSLLETVDSTNLLKDRKVREGLVYCNLFVGRASPIKSIDDGFEIFEKWIEESSESREMKKNYLDFRSKYSHLAKLDQFSPLLHWVEPREKLSPEKIKRLTDPAAIFALTQEEIVHILPEQVRHMNPNLMPKLKRPELIEKVPLDAIEELCESQHAHFTVDQMLQLSRRVSISKLPKSAIEKLQIKHLITPSNEPFIASLADKQIEWIKKANDCKSLKIEDWEKIGSEIKKRLSRLLIEEAVQKVSPEAVPFLEGSKIKYLKTKEQLKQIPAYQSAYRMRISQLNCMTTAQKIVYLLSRFLLLALVILPFTPLFPKMQSRVRGSLSKVHDLILQKLLKSSQSFPHPSLA